jgi:hypothetical protein
MVEDWISASWKLVSSLVFVSLQTIPAVNGCQRQPRSGSPVDPYDTACDPAKTSL